MYVSILVLAEHLLLESAFCATLSYTLYVCFSIVYGCVLTLAIDLLTLTVKVYDDKTRLYATQVHNTFTTTRIFHSTTLPSTQISCLSCAAVQLNWQPVSPLL